MTTNTLKERFEEKFPEGIWVSAHSEWLPKSVLAFIEQEISQALADDRKRLAEIVGVVDEKFLARPDAEDYVGEWAINKDRQRILKALESTATLVENNEK